MPLAWRSAATCSPGWSAACWLRCCACSCCASSRLAGGGATRLALAIPGLEAGQRVERRAAFVPARRRPALEVQVAAVGVAGVADVADQLAGEHVVALAHQRRL